jgi:hypothetical protein
VLDLDLSLTLVQIAEYWGMVLLKNSSLWSKGYLSCRTDTDVNEQSRKDSNGRQLLDTPDDWSHDRDGGVLRLFLGKDH